MSNPRLQYLALQPCSGPNVKTSATFFYIAYLAVTYSECKSRGGNFILLRLQSQPATPVPGLPSVPICDGTSTVCSETGLAAGSTSPANSLYVGRRKASRVENLPGRVCCCVFRLIRRRISPRISVPWSTVGAGTDPDTLPRACPLPVSSGRRSGEDLCQSSAQCAVISRLQTVRF